MASTALSLNVLSGALLIALTGLLATGLYHSEPGQRLRQRYRRQPLQAFTRDQQDMAFYLAPELRARYEATGMSMREYEKLLKDSLRRIEAEQRRRQR